MKNSGKFLWNTLLLTGVALLMRTVAVAFNVYVTEKLGAGGVGLFSLILSAYGFFSTFALSGVHLASSRLVAEGLGHGSCGEVRGSMRCCLAYGFCFGAAATVALFASAGVIGERLIADSRAVLPLRILAPSLLPLACSSAVSGYFYAVRRVGRSSLVQVLAQAVRIGVTVFAISAWLPAGVEYVCVALTVGITVSEGCSVLFLLLLWRRDMRKCFRGGEIPGGLLRKMLGISLPMALSTYARSGLLTLEHMLIPYGLRRFGRSGEAALAQYGILHGMAFPIVLYPQVFLQSFAGMLIPEMAETRARGGEKEIRRTAARVLQITLLFSIGVAGIMCCFAGELGRVIYANRTAGNYILMMAPLIPVMYLDSAVDGMLKGLGQQLYSMQVNILDASCSVLMVWLLLPRMGVGGYILTVYVCEILNGALSLVRLLQVTKPKVSLLRIFFLPLLCVAAAAASVRILLQYSGLTLLWPGGWALTAHCLLAAAVYMLLLWLTGCITLRNRSARQSLCPAGSEPSGADAARNAVREAELSQAVSNSLASMPKNDPITHRNRKEGWTYEAKQQSHENQTKNRRVAALRTALPANLRMDSRSGDAGQGRQERHSDRGLHRAGAI